MAWTRSVIVPPDQLRRHMRHPRPARLPRLQRLPRPPAQEIWPRSTRPRPIDTAAAPDPRPRRRTTAIRLRATTSISPTACINKVDWASPLPPRRTAHRPAQLPKLRRASISPAASSAMRRRPGPARPIHINRGIHPLGRLRWGTRHHPPPVRISRIFTSSFRRLADPRSIPSGHITTVSRRR